MNKQQEKELVNTAIANVEQQLLETKIQISLNRKLWDRQEHFRKETNSTFTAADAEAAKKARRDARLKEWALVKGLEAVHEDFAAILAYEPPDESETPAEGAESAPHADAVVAAAESKNEVEVVGETEEPGADEASVS